MFKKFLQLRSSILLLTIFLLFSSNALAVTWTYYVHTAPEATRELPSDSSFKVYKNETVNFISDNRDRDKKVDDSCDPNTEYYWASSSVYEQHWTITGKASFSSTSSVKSKDTSGLNSGNIYVHVDNEFGSGDTITVEMVLDDDSTNGPPGSDNDGNNARSSTWTLTYKGYCPTSAPCISPANCTGEKSNPQTYTYRCDPDRDPPGRPDYGGANGILINESFGAITSNIDKAHHVTAAGKTQNPTWTNNQWRDYFFSSGANASGVPDNSDQYTDTHGGFVNDGTSAFLVQPPPAGHNLYWDLPQSHTCNSDTTNLNESYTIRRWYKSDGSVTIIKS